jgi:hypothetical protein
MFSVTTLSSTVTLYCLPPISATANTVAGVNARPGGDELKARVASSLLTAPQLRATGGTPALRDRATRWRCPQAKSWGKAVCAGALREIAAAVRAAVRDARAPWPRTSAAAEATHPHIGMCLAAMRVKGGGFISL